MIMCMKLFSKCKKCFSEFVTFIMSHVLHYGTDLLCILTANFNAVRQRNASLSRSRGQDLPHSPMDNSECQQSIPIEGMNLAGFETQQQI